ncbi:hydroxymethylglutaryl-CoA lyase [Granulicella sibirica]|uniref:Hydroxymethylglutaryl-CoA lyase n=1 Tax=Granulicella sibirica TaxID=2479048 RepID=A0A4Q0T283_9BACT|nr:hydroxymethylglutaryl-CoA lyase [Granulicella sibirica]RXH56942.1 Hydroxymethylglutaryl-CoA lyase [Granulicella sibirica]
MSIVKIVECPRDAWQGLPQRMPAEVKADYLRVLIAAGFRHIDAVSFVSPEAFPQMADSELVLDYLDPSDDVEIIGIVLNAQGAERAIKTSAVQTLAFPYSISPTYLKKSQHQTPEEALDALEAVGTAGYKAGLDVVAYISMAFGNPYGDDWDIEEVVSACDLLVDNGITQISLADTVGLATPKLISDVLSDVFAVHDTAEIGVHLHARPDTATAKVRAAYGVGCRRFDGAIGGFGGCPLAQDTLVGNIATGTLIAELKRLGAKMSPVSPLESLQAASAEIARKFGAKVQ